MEYELSRAVGTEYKAAFGLIAERVKWFESRGIQQWGDGYCRAYPEAFFAEEEEKGRLYVLKCDGAVVAAAVILEEDDRWADAPQRPAYYIHNFASSTAHPGAGRAMLEAVEALARRDGKVCLRLDCGVDNAPLNAYYEAKGFMEAGTCDESPYYQGIRREKPLV